MHTTPIAVANFTSNESQYSAVSGVYIMLRPLCRKVLRLVQSRGYKTFIPNSAEHEIDPAHKR